MRTRTPRFMYVSERLTTQIVQRDQSSQRFTYTASVDLPHLFRIGWMRRQVDYRNRAELAARATKAVRAETGAIGDDTPYVRIAGVFRYGILRSLMGLERPLEPIASFLLLTNAGEGSGPFVGLVGSASGYLGYRASSLSESFAPSDIQGLLSIVALVRESSDANVDPEYMDYEKRLDSSDHIEAAQRILLRGAEGFPEAYLDVLAEVHYSATTPRQGRALVGAPVWVAQGAARDV